MDSGASCFGSFVVRPGITVLIKLLNERLAKARTSGKDIEIQNKLGRAVRTPQLVEQAGKGGKRKLGRRPVLIPSAPPLSGPMKTLGGTKRTSAGARSGSMLGGVLISACHPSQLVRPIEASLPFPTCSVLLAPSSQADNSHECLTIFHDKL